MPSLPTGTVTFLFIDIEGFTTLLRHKRSKAITAFREFPVALTSPALLAGTRSPITL